MHSTKALAAVMLVSNSALAAPRDQATLMKSSNTTADDAPLPPTDAITTLKPHNPAANINITLITVNNGECAGPDCAHLCGDSSFLDYTTDASPAADDCLVIVRNIQIVGKWDVNGRRRRLVQWGRCGFWVEPAAARASPWFNVGNMDIMDLIRDSVGKFAGLHGGMVAAGGTMRYEGMYGVSVYAIPVRWRIEHI